MKNSLSLLLVFISSAPSTLLAQSLPDLRPEISEITFRHHEPVDPADVAEGCAGGEVDRSLLRFTLASFNDGPGALNLGDPGCPDCHENPGLTCTNPLFECSAAMGHDHPHVRSFATYVLLDSSGQQVVRGHKEGFCLANSICTNIPPDDSGPFCSVLSPTCADLYPNGIGCQYIDATGVAPGNYTLRVELNRDRTIAEDNFTNNVTEVPVEICGSKKKLRLDISKPGKKSGNRKFKAAGTIDFHSSIEGFDPLAEGLSLTLRIDEITAFDLYLPPGGSSPACGSKDGWKRIRQNAWSYRNRSGFTDEFCTSSAQGVEKVKVVRLGNSLELKISGAFSVDTATDLPAFAELSVYLPSVTSTCASTETTNCTRRGPGRTRTRCVN